MVVKNRGPCLRLPSLSSFQSVMFPTLRPGGLGCPVDQVRSHHHKVWGILKVGGGGLTKNQPWVGVFANDGQWGRAQPGGSLPPYDRTLTIILFLLLCYGQKEG